MARILVLCPSHRDYRELARFGDGHDFIFHEYASTALEEMLSPCPPRSRVPSVSAEIETIVRRYGGAVEAIVSTDDYPGTTIASIVAQRLELPGTNPRANLICQHKLRSRELQRDADVPGTPDFEPVYGPHELRLALPCFLKPVKSFFSIGGTSLHRMHDLTASVRAATLPESFFDPLRMLFETYTGRPFGQGRIIAESLLGGHHATLEGYALKGRVHTIGVVDSTMFPGTSVFRRFSYPTALANGVVSRMADIARKALDAVGFDHGLFNVEFFYDPARDSVSVIEINPRMASQFADLYEKVDGINTYSTLIDLGLGRQPPLMKRHGKYRVAVSDVLRRFRDAEVRRVPSRDEVQRISERYPDARVEILATAGRPLSRELQDGNSFRYGIVNIGASSREEAYEVAAECRRVLRFGFRRLERKSGRAVESMQRSSDRNATPGDPFS